MRRYRWQLRTVMVFVALLAVSMGIDRELRRRGQSYRERALYHLGASQQLGNEGRSFLCTFGMSERQIEAIEARRAPEQRLALSASEYHKRLHKKYQLACERPWLPVGSDPPPPPGSYPVLVTADDY
jgi:hypothetical protein